MKHQVSNREINPVVIGHHPSHTQVEPLEELQPSSEDHHHHHHQQQQQQFQDSQNDDFLNQMLNNISNCSWPPTPHDIPSPPSNPTTNPNPNIGPFDEAALVSKLRHQQMNEATAKSMLMQQQQQQQQFLLPRRSPGENAAASPMLPLPLSLHNPDSVDPSSFKSQGVAEAAVQALYNGFSGSLQPTNQQHFHAPPPPPPQNYGGQAPPASAASTGGSSGGAPPQRQRVRARRGQATDPHSIAERLRRERIAERMKGLQELVPNANKTDKASMLDEIIDYVKFLQLQVKVLSMSRLGGAGAVGPLVADMTSEDGGGRNSNGNQTASAATTTTTNDSMTITEHQVAKLMEEDMGSAMQYLQGKGLCLMPISLATAISTATSISRNPLPPTRPHVNGNGNLPHHILPSISSSNGEGDNNTNTMSITKGNPVPDPDSSNS